MTNALKNVAGLRPIVNIQQFGADPTGVAESTASFRLTFLGCQDDA